MLVLELALDEVRYAVEADRVAEIAPRVVVTPLPDAPTPVLGVISVRGKLVPVVDLRARLGHPARAPRIEDHFVIANSGRRTVGLVVDRALGLREIRASELHPPVLPSKQIAGVVVLSDGLVLLQDLDRVLSIDEESAIDRGLEALSP